MPRYFTHEFHGRADVQLNESIEMLFEPTTGEIQQAQLLIEQKVLPRGGDHNQMIHPFKGGQAVDNQVQLLEATMPLECRQVVPVIEATWAFGFR